MTCGRRQHLMTILVMVTASFLILDVVMLRVLSHSRSELHRAQVRLAFACGYRMGIQSSTTDPRLFEKCSSILGEVGPWP